MDWKLFDFIIPRTRFKSLDEYYPAIDTLSAWLERDGHSSDARKLDALMHEAAFTTSSELLGELALVLRSMRGDYSAALRAEIRECERFARHHRRILRLS